MSRPSPWLLAATVLALAGPAPVRAADPIDLARGLRDNGLPDLALEYLTELAEKRPAPATLAVLPLERARTRLDLAAAETDDARRTTLVAAAKADFDGFLAANPTHPRRAEAALSLARLISVQAKGVVSKANKLPEPDQVRQALLAARPVFQDAAKRFALAAKEFAKKLDEPGVTPAAKKFLQNDLYQAQLDEAINLFQLASTYPTAGAAAADIVERGKAIDASKALFTRLSAEDPNHPLCWVAQAWAGECEQEKQSAVEAQKKFEAVKQAAVRMPAVAAQGARTARFFEMRAEYLKAFGENNLAGLKKSQGQIEAWLADPALRSPRPTPELSAARYYLGMTKLRQAEAQIKIDPKTMQPVLQGNARELLQGAERDLRRLADPENDYTARAAKERTLAVRRLIGDPDKIDPAKLTDFEMVLMTAQVQMYRAVREADSDGERQRTAARAVGLYERLQQLPTPKEFARDAQEAQANLAYAYILADRPYEAAVLADSVCRTSRSPATASRAGLYAILAYRQAAAAVNVADPGARRADEERAVAVGLHLDRQYPLDSNTDTARVQVTQYLLQSRRYREAFALTARVPAGSPVILNARFLQSLAAFELLRATDSPDGATAALPPAEKAEIFQRTLADLQAVPDVPADTARGDARLSVLLALQQAELHFLNGAGELPKAEQATVAAAKKLATLTALPPDDKSELEFRVELARMRALYGQALTAFQQKKYGDAVLKLAPVLQEAKEKGPVTRPDMAPEVATLAKKVDEYRREKLLGLAMQARVREGAVDKVGELLDVLKKLGGSLANSAGTLQVLVEGVRPQIDALRREGKAAEADALAKGIGGILDKVAAEPDVKPPTIIVLAQGLNSIGNPDKALEFLKRIEPPRDPAMLKKRLAEIPDEKDQLAVSRYRAAQLETARAYRVGKKFAEADAALKEPLGDAKGAGGWANNGEFRREAAYLLEARAAEAPTPAEAKKLWSEARGKWTEQANVYFVPLKKLAGAKSDAKLAFVALFDLKSLPKNDRLPTQDAQIRAALAEAKPPQWLAELTVERGKGADGKPVENPVAVAYVEEMRNVVRRLETALKPQYHDLVFESVRCLTKANTSLLKANPAALATQYDTLAKQIFQLEAANPDLADAVRGKFADLLDETPGMKDSYGKLGGKMFVKGAAPTAQ